MCIYIYIKPEKESSGLIGVVGETSFVVQSAKLLPAMLESHVGTHWCFDCFTSDPVGMYDACSV